jgi:hypothetical protein
MFILSQIYKASAAMIAQKWVLLIAFRRSKRAEFAPRMGSLGLEGLGVEACWTSKEHQIPRCYVFSLKIEDLL